MGYMTNTWITKDSGPAHSNCISCDMELGFEYDDEFCPYWLIGGEHPMCELCYDRTIDAGEDPLEVCEHYAALQN